jgi:hypothetical protein
MCHSFWARAYYAQQRAKGSTHHAASRAFVQVEPKPVALLANDHTLQ